MSEPETEREQLRQLALEAALALPRPASALGDLWRGLARGAWQRVATFEEVGGTLVLFRRRREGEALALPLGLRERQTVELAALGRSVTDIARALGLSKAAASTALRAGLMRLGLRNRFELVRLYGPLVEAALR